MTYTYVLVHVLERILDNSVFFFKFEHYVLFYQEPEPAPGIKFLEPPKNRPASKPCSSNK